jgi:thymidylate synthase ThyX
MEKYSEEDTEILKRHVSNFDSNIYVIFNLPPEVVAVLFAFVSRSPNSFRDNLLKLVKGKELDAGKLIHGFAEQSIDYSQAKQKAKEFHEKWVVGYGHSSVAEHACASVALEDVSIIASKIIEDNRLASYTEKSTRYQEFDRNRYYKPKNLMDSELGKLYEETANYLFDVYAELIPKLVEYVKKLFPKSEKMNDKFYETISRARAFDIVRYILPAATLTNLAMTTNARNYEHAIRKFLSHHLEEIREIGAKMKEEVKKIIPTLVMFADKNDYLNETPNDMQELVPKMAGNAEPNNSAPVTLIDYDKDAYNKIVAAMLYRFTHIPYAQAMEKVKALSEEDKEKLIDTYLKKMTQHDWPMRELEHINYTFDILVDYGAFRDIQRHRICTQTNQEPTVEHGYDIPEEIIDAGFKEQFESCMKKAEEAYRQIVKKFPREAQYIVPLAFKKRTLFTWNLRSLHHFIKLRTGKEGHISYRKIAKACYDEINKVHPLLAKYIRVHDIEGPSRG